MASTNEIREQIKAKETEVLQHADAVSKASKAKRQAEQDIAKLKDLLLNAMEQEFASKGKGK